MTRRAWLGAFAGLLVLASMGCARSHGPSNAGRAARVVSLSPSTTEAMFAIGAGAQLVGRSRYCDYPPEARALPEVGGYVDPSLEAILARTPDLVVGARGPAGAGLAAKLEAHGIASYFASAERFDDVDAMIRELGARTGHEADAARVILTMRAREDAIARSLRDAPRARVLFVVGLEPIIVAGPDGFTSEMVQRAGGDNVIAEGGAYPAVGIERILTLDPDVIVDAASPGGTSRITPRAPGWSELRAVQRGHVIALADDRVLRPGPRVAEGVATLARALHPNLAIP